jgi:hypothetical protein
MPKAKNVALQYGVRGGQSRAPHVVYLTASDARVVAAALHVEAIHVDSVEYCRRTSCPPNSVDETVEIQPGSMSGDLAEVMVTVRAPSYGGPCRELWFFSIQAQFRRTASGWAFVRELEAGEC